VNTLSNNFIRQTKLTLLDFVSYVYLLLSLCLSLLLSCLSSLCRSLSFSLILPSVSFSQYKFLNPNVIGHPFNFRTDLMLTDNQQRPTFKFGSIYKNNEKNELQSSNDGSVYRKNEKISSKSDEFHKKSLENIQKLLELSPDSFLLSLFSLSPSLSLSFSNLLINYQSVHDSDSFILFLLNLLPSLSANPTQSPLFSLSIPTKKEGSLSLSTLSHLPLVDYFASQADMHLSSSQYPLHEDFDN
jgi:hypothetical protein